MSTMLHPRGRESKTRSSKTSRKKNATAPSSASSSAASSAYNSDNECMNDSACPSPEERGLHDEEGLDMLSSSVSQIIEELTDKRTATRMAALKAIVSALSRQYDPERLVNMIETLMSHLLVCVKKGSSTEESLLACHAVDLVLLSVGTSFPNPLATYEHMLTVLLPLLQASSKAKVVRARIARTLAAACLVTAEEVTDTLRLCDVFAKLFTPMAQALLLQSELQRQQKQPQANDDDDNNNNNDNDEQQASIASLPSLSTQSIDRIAEADAVFLSEVIESFSLLVTILPYKSLRRLINLHVPTLFRLLSHPAARVRDAAGQACALLHSHYADHAEQYPPPLPHLVSSSPSYLVDESSPSPSPSPSTSPSPSPHSEESTSSTSPNHNHHNGTNLHSSNGLNGINGFTKTSLISTSSSKSASSTSSSSSSHNDDTLWFDTSSHLESLSSVLGMLSSSSSRRDNRSTRLLQKRSFREYVKSIEDGERPSVSLIVRKQKLEFEGWDETIQLEWVRNTLGAGLVAHLEGGNPLLHDMFDVDGAALARAADVSTQRASRSAMLTAARARAIVTDAERRKERRSKNAHLQLPDDDLH